MAAIVEFVSGDRTLILGNEQYIRRMSFGADWDHIQIVIRAAPYASSSFTWSLAIGVTSQGRGYYALDSDMVGASWGESVSYVAGPPRSFTWTWGGGNVYIFRRKNNVNTNTGVGNSGLRSGSVMPIMNVWGVDIAKSGNNGFTIGHCDCGIAVATGGASMSRSVFRESIHYDMTSPNGSSSNRNCYAVETTSTITGYAGDGQLDSVLIKYGSNTQPLCISDIFVYRYT